MPDRSRRRPTPDLATRVCYFCTRLADGPPDPLIHEDDLLHVSHAINEQGPLSHLGYVVLQTKRHTEHGLAGLTDSEAERAGLRVTQVSRALRELLGASWTYTYAYTEAFQHYHQFVVARYPRMPRRYVRLGALEWKRFPRGDRAHVERLAEQMTSYLR